MESCWQESMRGLSSDKLITSGSADSIKCFTCSFMAVTRAIFDISCAKKKLKAKRTVSTYSTRNSPTNHALATQSSHRNRLIIQGRLNTILIMLQHSLILYIYITLLSVAPVQRRTCAMIDEIDSISLA